MNRIKETIEFDFIKLKRTECYGTCPVYKVKIYSNGIVEYNGVMFVKKIGSYQWKIDKKAVNLLNEYIKKHGYFGIKKKEPTQIMTDHPYCITSIQLKDKSFRKIDNYKGDNCYSKRLTTFENKIDKIIGITDYIGDRDLFD